MPLGEELTIPGKSSADYWRAGVNRQGDSGFDAGAVLRHDSLY
jgi:hypothetical protein